MSVKVYIYEEPGVLLAVAELAPELDPVDQAGKLLQGGLDQGRKVMALIEDPGKPGAPTVYPSREPITVPFPELTEQVQQTLGERRVFDAVFLMDSALRGENAEDPDVWMLAASVYELVRLFNMALPLLEKAFPHFDGLRKDATGLRLARAMARTGNMQDVPEMVKEALTNEELPQILRIEGLLLLAMGQPKEEALETIDELLDAAEEHLGDHRLAAEALELQADLLSDDDPKKAQQFYLAAGKMLLRLQDPYFFGLNERLVMHHLKHREMETALALSQEMFQVVKQTGGPPVVELPFLMFACWIHEQMGDKERADAARQAAMTIDPNEVQRVEANIKQTLVSSVRA